MLGLHLLLIVLSDSNYIANDCITNFIGKKKPTSEIIYYDFVSLCPNLGISCGIERLKVLVGLNDTEYCHNEDKLCKYLLRYGYKQIIDEHHVCITYDKKSCSIIEYYDTDGKCFNTDNLDPSKGLNTFIIAFIFLSLFCCVICNL